MLHVETHTCGNVVSAAIMFCVFAAMARPIEQRGRHVTRVLIEMSRKLAAYNYASSLALEQHSEYELVDTN